MSEGPLVDVGALAKPATVLVERISDAVGGIFKPYQVIRVAKAEAQAEVIRAEADIHVSDLHRRAFRRFLGEEATKQQNIESVTRQALPQLSATSKPESIEQDWLVNFFDKSRLTSDSEMQALWAKVLAGEANQPGSFSKRTVNFLQTLTKVDAELFTGFCTYCFQFGLTTPLIFTHNDQVYQKRSLTFNNLMHLEGIGLIQFNAVVGFVRQNLPKSFAVSYFGQPVHLTMPGAATDIAIGSALLTSMGEELAPITGATPDPEFLDYVLKQWAGYSPSLLREGAQ